MGLSRCRPSLHSGSSESACDSSQGSSQFSCPADGLFTIWVTREPYGRGIRDQIANICWIIKKAREFQKTSTIYFCFIDYAKAFDSVDHNKLWKILKDMGLPHHLNCLLRNLYAGQEATVRTRHGTTDWFQIGKGVHQGCILSLCYLTYMQGTSCEILGWMKHKLESRLSGEISTTSDMQMIPF